MQRLYPSSTRVVSVGHGFFHPSNPSNSFFSLFDSAKSNQISGNFLRRQIVTKKLRSTHTHTHSMGSGEWKEKTFKFHYNHRSSFIVYRLLLLNSIYSSVYHMYKIVTFDWRQQWCCCDLDTLVYRHHDDHYQSILMADCLSIQSI